MRPIDYRSEVFLRVMATGKRLMDAQKTELKLAKAFRQLHDAESLRHLKAARQEVDRLAEMYLEAIRNHRSAMAAQYPAEDSSTAPYPGLPLWEKLS